MNSITDHPEEADSRKHIHHTPNDDESRSFDEMVQVESSIIERALTRISNVNRERGLSNLGQSSELVDADGKDEEQEFIRLPDMRQQLFEAIPEPYYESQEFRRVIVTNLKDQEGDRDSREACKLLKKCMAIREKWMSHHPSPPQDLSDNCFDSFPSIPPTPARAISGNAQTVAERQFRRRLVPPYEVFEKPVPEGATDLEFKMIRGVVMVRKVVTPVISEKKDGDDTKGAVESNDYYLSSTDEADSPVHRRRKASTASVTSNTSATSSVSDWTQSIFPVPSFEEFIKDFQFIRKSVFSGPVATYAFNRLEFLSAKFNLHCLLNATLELEAQKSVPHRDFYNVRKVDTHVHHSACMNQKHLLRFIKHKLKQSPTEAVIFRDGRFLTLGEVFKSLNLTAYDLSIDTLDMHANNTFHRFDKFNLKYNPAGQSRLREIFLKTDNVIGGRYLAEITQEVMNDLTASKYQLVEWRISIYGRKASEWSSLARWFYIHRLAHPNVRWLIQIPRLYDIYRRSGEIQSFGQMLQNIFLPLFAVSIDPSSNPPLHYLLQTVVGIDSVDDESRPEHDQLRMNNPIPELWDMPHNPPYGYWMYYMYANICTLNQLRASRGLCTFQFRPHCGEAGDLDHLIGTYFLANQINHGILLRKNPALQYLYYLSQIGLAMSPLSNNKLFLDYNKNPFIKYFQLGMNVSLSTDDPLMLHMTKDALLEEYSVASQVWKLSSCDQCEIARNSVLQSGWERKFKLHFLGKDFSDIRETNVPMIRLLYRQETLLNEIQEVDKNANA